MAFGEFDNEAGDKPIAQINMIPLIDVMLVLLVIFIITAPLLTHAVKVDLPKASSNPNVIKRDKIELAVDREGIAYWNGERVEDSGLRVRMDAAAKVEPQPELHIRADGDVPYRRVAQLMSAAAKAGLTRVGFISDPSAP